MRGEARGVLEQSLQSRGDSVHPRVLLDPASEPSLRQHEPVPCLSWQHRSQASVHSTLPPTCSSWAHRLSTQSWCCHLEGLTGSQRTKGAAWPAQQQQPARPGWGSALQGASGTTQAEVQTGSTALGTAKTEIQRQDPPRLQRRMTSLRRRLARILPLQAATGSPGSHNGAASLLGHPPTSPRGAGSTTRQPQRPPRQGWSQTADLCREVLTRAQGLCWGSRHRGVRGALTRPIHGAGREHGPRPGQSPAPHDPPSTSRSDAPTQSWERVPSTRRCALTPEKARKLICPGL